MRTLPSFLPTLLLALLLRPDPGALIASYVVDPRAASITLHWKDAQGTIYGDLGSLQRDLQEHGRQLLFGMNGGMYMADRSPVGLYIEDGRILHPIDRRTTGSGNFHMQPNGVFGITAQGEAFVRTTAAMTRFDEVRYATQSGPMLLVNGTINAAFTKGSKNLNIRNGVGILKDGRVLFAISRGPINFHDFASWFLAQGCEQALYLDGFVSKAFIPAEGLRQLDGDLGVLIAVSSEP